MHLWNKEKFEAIGNCLMSSIKVDMSFLETGRMSVAKILMEIDLREGVLVELELVSSSGL